MAKATLVIGTPNLSSWSLRPWLLMRQLEISFEEVLIELDRPTSKAEILRHSPAGRVPVLKEGGLAIWESLAIIEYLAERSPELEVWPRDRAARAEARSLSAEMHSGFAALRDELPLEVTARRPGTTYSADAAADIARIVECWEAVLARHRGGGGFLFGAFSAADAMFAPVVSRFITYDVPLGNAAAGYRDLIWNLSAMAEWRAKAGEA
ncbi:MAG: glutathione S-transferase [Alphaproteobacteria bacterium]|jgi:glutathione S-transferase|nr:glutathione S-transferase [Alphaproteobacteria bacterium]